MKIKTLNLLFVLAAPLLCLSAKAGYETVGYDQYGNPILQMPTLTVTAPKPKPPPPPPPPPPMPPIPPPSIPTMDDGFGGGGGGSLGGGGGGGGGGSVSNTGNAQDCTVAAIKNILKKLGIKDDGLVLSKFTENLGKFGGDSSMLDLLMKGVSASNATQINAYIQAMVATLQGYIGSQATVSFVTDTNTGGMMLAINSASGQGGIAMIALSGPAGGHVVAVTYNNDSQNPTYTFYNIDGAGNNATATNAQFVTGSITYNGSTYKTLTNIPTITVTPPK